MSSTNLCVEQDQTDLLFYCLHFERDIFGLYAAIRRWMTWESPEERSQAAVCIPKPLRYTLRSLHLSENHVNAAAWQSAGALSGLGNPSSVHPQSAANVDIRRRKDDC
jgi:hypothetical protein